MDKRTRAYRIYQEATHLVDGNEQLLQAIAIMLDYATKKPTKKAVSLLYTELDVAAAFEQYNVYFDIRRKGRLNRILKHLELRPDDPACVASYVVDVVVPFCATKTIPFTWDLVCRRYEKWLESARTHEVKPQKNPAANWR